MENNDIYLDIDIDLTDLEDNDTEIISSESLLDIGILEEDADLLNKDISVDELTNNSEDSINKRSYDKDSDLDEQKNEESKKAFQYLNSNDLSYRISMNAEIDILMKDSSNNKYFNDSELSNIVSLENKFQVRVDNLIVTDILNKGEAPQSEVIFNNNLSYIIMTYLKSYYISISKTNSVYDAEEFLKKLDSIKCRDILKIRKKEGDGSVLDSKIFECRSIFANNSELRNTLKLRTQSEEMNEEVLSNLNPLNLFSGQKREKLQSVLNEFYSLITEYIRIITERTNRVKESSELFKEKFLVGNDSNLLKGNEEKFTIIDDVNFADNTFKCGCCGAYGTLTDDFMTFMFIKQDIIPDIKVQKCPNNHFNLPTILEIKRFKNILNNDKYKNILTEDSLKDIKDTNTALRAKAIILRVRPSFDDLSKIETDVYKISSNKFNDSLDISSDLKFSDNIINMLEMYRKESTYSCVEVEKILVDRKSLDVISKIDLSLDARRKHKSRERKFHKKELANQNKKGLTIEESIYLSQANNNLLEEKSKQFASILGSNKSDKDFKNNVEKEIKDIREGSDPLIKKLSKYKLNSDGSSSDYTFNSLSDNDFKNIDDIAVLVCDSVGEPYDIRKKEAIFTILSFIDSLSFSDYLTPYLETFIIKLNSYINISNNIEKYPRSNLYDFIDKIERDLDITIDVPDNIDDLNIDKLKSDLLQILSFLRKDNIEDLEFKSSSILNRLEANYLKLGYLDIGVITFDTNILLSKYGSNKRLGKLVDAVSSIMIIRKYLQRFIKNVGDLNGSYKYLEELNKVELLSNGEVILNVGKGTKIFKKMVKLPGSEKKSQTLQFFDYDDIKLGKLDPNIYRVAFELESGNTIDFCDSILSVGNTSSQRIFDNAFYTTDFKEHLFNEDSTLQKYSLPNTGITINTPSSVMNRYRLISTLYKMFIIERIDLAFSRIGVTSINNKFKSMYVKVFDKLYSYYTEDDIVKLTVNDVEILLDSKLVIPRNESINDYVKKVLVLNTVDSFYFDGIETIECSYNGKCLTYNNETISEFGYSSILEAYRDLDNRTIRSDVLKKLVEFSSTLDKDSKYTNDGIIRTKYTDITKEDLNRISDKDKNFLVNATTIRPKGKMDIDTFIKFVHVADSYVFDSISSNIFYQYNDSLEILSNDDLIKMKFASNLDLCDYIERNKDNTIVQFFSPNIFDEIDFYILPLKQRWLENNSKSITSIPIIDLIFNVSMRNINFREYFGLSLDDIGFKLLKDRVTMESLLPDKFEESVLFEKFLDMPSLNVEVSTYISTHTSTNSFNPDYLLSDLSFLDEDGLSLNTRKNRLFKEIISIPITDSFKEKYDKNNRLCLLTKDAINIVKSYIALI